MTFENQDEATVSHRNRRSKVYWLQFSNELDWVFKRIATEVNLKRWGYHLAGISEPLQLTHYESQDRGHYDWHDDHGDSAFLHRKLSTSLLLNDSFEGGNFEIVRLGKVQEFNKGSMIMFPSFKLHRVTPVLSGER
jgi:PKHD-type hydroxylase